MPKIWYSEIPVQHNVTYCITLTWLTQKKSKTIMNLQFIQREVCQYKNAYSEIYKNLKRRQLKQTLPQKMIKPNPVRGRRSETGEIQCIIKDTKQIHMGGPNKGQLQLAHPSLTELLLTLENMCATKTSVKGKADVRI